MENVRDPVRKTSFEQIANLSKTEFPREKNSFSHWKTTRLFDLCAKFVVNILTEDGYNDKHKCRVHIINGRNIYVR